MPNFQKKFRIVFMGTPEIAVASLDAIVKAGYDVVAVVTAPDRPAGRGKKIRFSAVKEYALENNLNLLQPVNLKDPEFAEQIRSLKPDLMVVVAFRMLPKVIWSIPEYGTFNMHASLLPDLRGAAPINRAVIYGYKKTGVTTFFINEEIDKGDVIFKEVVYIDEVETAGSLHDKLMIRGAALVVKTIKHIEKGDFQKTGQNILEDDFDELRLAPKIFKEDCKIDWNNCCQDIVNLIHGLNPIPGAFAEMNLNLSIGNANYKILNASFEKIKHTEKPGKIFTDGKNYINVAAQDGFVQILTIQEPGKRLLNTPDYLRGVKIKENLQ